jgi:hypothetical protein
MLVGIIDYDIFINSKKFIPNPEVMLISAWHKKKGDIVHLLLNGKDIQVYDKVYLRRNSTNKKVKIPNWLYGLPGADTGGAYFTNGNLVGPAKEFLEVLPDKTIYDKYFRYMKDKKMPGIHKYNFGSFISLKKPETLISSEKNTYIYDSDLGSKETFDQLQKLYEEGLFKKITFCYPIRCSSIEEALPWTQVDWITKSATTILVDSTVTLKQIDDFRKQNSKITIQAHLTKKTRFLNSNEYYWEVINAVNKTLFCIINNVPIQFDLPPTFRANDGNILLQQVYKWNKSKIQSSFQNHCLSSKMKEELSNLLQKYPEHRELFETSPHEYKSKGGVWYYGRL